MKEKNIVVFGKFDGVHIGHAGLLEKAAEVSRTSGMPIVIYVISPKRCDAITDDAEKENILKSFGADKVIFRTLDSKLKNMLPEEFVRDVVHTELNAAYVVVGDNFCFGKDRCGNSRLLHKLCKDMGIECFVADMVRMEGSDGGEENVSSTAVRRYLALGYVDFVYRYLGRFYSIKGEITHGKHLGTSMGFPTANIIPPHSLPDMKKGVYISCIRIDDVYYKSITNVGYNPTVDNATTLISETHILDKNIDCYGKQATVFFIKFIRQEISFGGAEELFAQIESDVLAAKKFWGENPELISEIFAP